MRNGYLLVGVGLGTVALITILAVHPSARDPDSSTESAASPTQGIGTAAAGRGSPDAAESTVNAVKRKNYVEALDSRMRQINGEAGARESQQALVIKSPDFERRETRGPFMSGAFSLQSQNALCAMGFNTVTIKGTSLLDPGTNYAMRCKETTSEAREREKAESSKRQAFAEAFEAAGSQSDPSDPRIHVHADKTEFVMDVGDVDAKGIASQLPLVVSSRQQQNACDLGFTATRVRSTRNPKGVLVPFKCN